MNIDDDDCLCSLVRAQLKYEIQLRGVGVGTFCYVHESVGVVRITNQDFYYVIDITPDSKGQVRFITAKDLNVAPVIKTSEVCYFRVVIPSKGVTRYFQTLTELMTDIHKFCIEFEEDD